MQEVRGAGDVEARELIREIFEASAAVRYVAVARGVEIVSQQRNGVAGPSTAESDFYEEVLVNPTMLTLLRQRGELDCGGLRYVIVAYGNFFQLVRALESGHLSVCVEASADPVAVEAVVETVVQSRNARR
jgi:hypothetical protein